MPSDINKKKSLFSDFPPTGKKEWEALIRQDLNVADYRKKLDWDTLEGISVPPFFTKSDLKKLEIDGSAQIHSTARWQCCEPVYEDAPEKANRSIKKAVQFGAEACLISTAATPSFSLTLEGDIAGTNLQSQNDFNRLIDGIKTDFEFIFDCGMAAPAFRAMVQNTGRNNLTCSYVFDPFTYTARHGRLPVNKKRLREIIRLLADSHNDFTLCADVSFYHNAGASIIQELGIALSIGSEFLSSVQIGDRKSAAQSLFARVSAGPLYFPGIAKFRALRLLWQQLLDAYGIKNPKSLKIIAETGRVNKTVAASSNNIIRTVTEGMSAVIGGVDILMIHPHDAVYSIPSEKSKRIARNIQHIIREEAHFDKINDPAAGAYYIEFLTDAIARKAWAYFKQIEAEGGFLQALKNGSVQQEVQRSRNKKEEAYQAGKKVLVGVNRYPDPKEKMPETKQHSAFVTSLRKTDYQFNPKNGEEMDLLKKAFQSEAVLDDVLPFYHDPQKVLFMTIEKFRAENHINREGA